VSLLDKINPKDIADPSLLKLANLALSSKIKEFKNLNNTSLKIQAQKELNLLKNKTQELFDNLVKNQNFSANNSFLFGSDLLSSQIAVSTNDSLTEMNEIALKNGLPTVDLENCFDQLRSSYNYSSDTNFLVMTNNYDSLMNLDNLDKPMASDSFAYSIYTTDTREKLDTDVCTKVKIKTPLQNTTGLNMSLYHNLSQAGIDIFDKNSSAFQDRCCLYVDNSTDYDTTIGYRRQNYYQNLTVSCGDTCTYSGIDSNNYLECICNKTNGLEIQSDFNNDTGIFDTNMGTFNMDIIGCYYVAFKTPDILSNVGFYASLSFFTGGMVLAVLANILHNNMLTKSLDTVLYNDCEFYDKKIFTPEEYFNKPGVANIPGQPPQTGKVLNSPKGRRSNNENRPLTEISHASKDDHSKDNVLVLNDNKHNTESNVEIVKNPILLNNYNLNQVSNVMMTFNSQNSHNKSNRSEINGKDGNDHSSPDLIMGKHCEDPDEEIKLKRAIVLNDKNHRITLKDYEKLSLDEIIKYDNRGFFTFMKDHILDGHILLSIFKKSLVEPIYIRVILLVYIISMSFAFNAICFSDDYINSRASEPERVRDSFFYSVIYEFPKTLISIGITTILEIIARLIVYIPKKFEEELIEVMQTKNIAKVQEAK
jgi:hypothetical protein